MILAEPFYGAAPDMGVYENQTEERVEPWILRGSGDIVSDLKIYDMEHAGQWAILSEMEIGTEAFGNGDATFSTIPGDLRIEEWIRTSAASRTKNYLFTAAEFELNSPRHVMIAPSDDITSKPESLSEYVETEFKLTLAESSGDQQQMTVYQRTVEAGQVVTLGRNSTDGASDVPMYAVMVGTPVSVSVEDPCEPGLDFELNQIYPNPLAGSATISFDLAGGANVLIKIYDTMGREVAEVASGIYRAGHTPSNGMRTRCRVVSTIAIWKRKGSRP